MQASLEGGRLKYGTNADSSESMLTVLPQLQVVFTNDMLAQHIAYIITTASNGKRGEKIVIEPTAEAEEQWGLRIASMAVAGSAIIGCTPGYLNLEGMADMILHLPLEEQMKAARRGIWMKGIADYVAVIEEWRKDGKLDGLVVTTV